MSFIDTYNLGCNNCGHVASYTEMDSFSDKIFTYHVDCRKCGKRLILEFRRKRNPKRKHEFIRYMYLNGCDFKGIQF